MAKLSCICLLYTSQLGKAKPEIVLSYLDRLDNELANFLPSMLCGLEQSRLKEAAIKEAVSYTHLDVYKRQVLRNPARTLQCRLGTDQISPPGAHGFREATAVHLQ